VLPLVQGENPMTASTTSDFPEKGALVGLGAMVVGLGAMLVGLGAMLVGLGAMVGTVAG
jgi:hypothetical protein